MRVGKRESEISRIAEAPSNAVWWGVGAKVGFRVLSGGLDYYE